MWKDFKNYFSDFDGATNACRTVALWVCIVFALSFIASQVYILVAQKRNAEKISAETKSIVNGMWITVALFVASCLIVTFIACYFSEVASGKETLQPILFYPLAVCALAAIGCGIALFVKPVRLIKIVSACVCGAAFITVLVCMIVYNARGDAGEVYNNAGLYVSAAFIVAAMTAFAFFCDKRRESMDTKTVTYAAVCVALSFALSYVRIFKLPMGGSITFASMLPLMLFALMFGCKKGLLVGLVYGALQAVQDPWIVHPAQFVLDYAAAFAAIGLSGCMRDLGALKGNLRAQFAVGASIACAVRFICHYFAGVFAFGMYGAGFAEQYNISALANPYFYSFVYQCMYILPELAIVLAAGMIAFSSKAFRRQIEQRAFVKPAPQNSSDAVATEEPVATETPTQTE